MTSGQIASLVIAATAFLGAAAHFLADARGWMDSVRKVPIQPPSASLAGLPPVPPAPPSETHGTA